MPLVFIPGLIEIFRSPKEILMRTEAIVGAFALVAAVVYGGTARLRELVRARAVVAVVAGTLLWAVVTTFTSTHRMLSIDSLVTAVASVVLFVCVWYIAPKIPAKALLVLVPAVVLNAILIALQGFQIWNPFRFSTEYDVEHLLATGMIGNPNDVGAYFALSSLILLLASPVLGGRWRWISLAAGIVAACGLLLSQARTALLALGAAMILIGMRRSYKAAVAVIVLLAAALAVGAFLRVPVITRLVQLPRHAMKGEWNIVLSDRMPAFLAAAEMFRDHPLVGVGPGVYKFHFFDYRIAVTEKYPAGVVRAAGVNFSEVHNDHLQFLAETGLPGYALFFAALLILAGRWKHGGEDQSERARLASALGLPLAGCLFVLALAFFPLQIAITRHLLITVSALILGWRST